MHRAVHVFVFNSRGELFVQKRSMAKDRSPGRYDSSASGHLDAGEDYNACAARELREELNLEASVCRVFKIAASLETDWEHVWLYECHTDKPIQINPREIESGQFWTLADIDRLVTERPEQCASAFVRLYSKWRQQTG
jgi:isopentenyldiphosphate isomerase